jgi:hypothetical protein
LHWLACGLTAKRLQKSRELAREAEERAETNLHHLRQAGTQSRNIRYTYHSSISDAELLPVFNSWYEVLEEVHPDQAELETRS